MAHTTDYRICETCNELYEAGDWPGAQHICEACYISAHPRPWDILIGGMEIKAISTKYLGPTLGGRIKAYDMDGNQVTIPYDHSLASPEAHEKAALELRDKMDWIGNLIAIKHGYGYVFVMTDWNRWHIHIDDPELD